MVKSAPGGYMLIMLMMVVFVLSIGLLVAVPVWQTQIQRENEEELIFRGRQYVEAVRVFTRKNPGRFPASFKELEENGFLRRAYPDPMTESGAWDIILQSESISASVPGGETGQTILIAPEAALDSLSNPRILGVVSTSTKKAFRVLNEKETYDAWLFYYGHDPENPPRIIRHGEKKDRP